MCLWAFGGLCTCLQITLFCFPISFFYYFLFYTDTCSTLSIVLMQYLSMRGESRQAMKWTRQLIFTLVRRYQWLLRDGLL